MSPLDEPLDAGLVEAYRAEIREIFAVYDEPGPGHSIMDEDEFRKLLVLPRRKVRRKRCP